jgi:ABC-type glycerol-3-phosphate transport system substrate-binding protein
MLQKRTSIYREQDRNQTGVNLKVIFTNRFFFLLTLILGLIATNPIIIPTFAQNNYVTLTLSLPLGMEYLHDARIFESFEQQNADIRVNVVYSDLSTVRYPSAIESLEDHLSGAESYSLTADVLITSVGSTLPPEISLEATRAGYFLNLAPLLQADSNFSEENFYSSVWQSAAWDNGVWLLPVATNVYTVIYNRAAFDARGITYPEGSWDMATYASTIQSLAQRDGTGVLQSPSFIGYNRSDFALMYSLLGSPLYDPAMTPKSPYFDRPEVIGLAEAWSSLYGDGGAYNPAYLYSNFQVETTALTIDRIQTTIGNTNVGAALLPNNRAAITVVGFAVSGQTLYPEAAYKLVKFLANDVRVADAVITTFSMTTRSRSSYSETPDIEDAPFLLGNLSEENEALLQEAIQNAIPFSELHFFDYFSQATLRIANQGLDVRTTLQDAQLQAQTALETASEQKDQSSSGVSTPIPLTQLEPGEVSLRFRFSTVNQLPVMAAWDQFIDDFVLNDPQVGQIIFDTQLSDPNSTAQDFDCFYLPYNAVPQLNLDDILSLSPLISSDVNLSSDDFLPTVLSQVQLDNQIWAFPLDIYPDVIWFNSELLTQVGVTLPEFGWDANVFENNIRQLQNNLGQSTVFASPRLGTTLLMLIAAYGGMPIDYRTHPPTINFTSAENAAAIRQVLDLAKEGLIRYESLAEIPMRTQFDETPMFVDIFTPANLDQSEILPISFPVNTLFSPVAYDLGTAYISRNTPNPEACYRLISALSNRPELLNGMSVRRSALINSTTSTSQGENANAFYTEYGSLIESSNSVVFPSRIGANTVSAFVLQYWLFRAFDNYIQENADLENALIGAEQLTLEYLECSGNLPPFDTTLQTRREYNRQFIECAVQVDPNSASYFLFGG